MHWLVWVFASVFFGVSYRLGYKLVSDKFSVLFNVAVITLVTSFICFALFFLWEPQKFKIEDMRLQTLWPLLLIGVIMSGLEISIMMMYRSGGPVSISQSMASALVGLIIFAIGLIAFKDQLNTGQVAGWALGVAGVSLMTYYSR